MFYYHILNQKVEPEMPIDPIDILESKGFSIDYVNDKYDKNIYGALQLEEKL